ncbi:glycerophosphodiester phosphodiesterase family protein, partial [uncultured Secundilactobacillus sp.]|uniref:glycerophosphodiester phosphodiesterase family protein n=1 Tax=uncultured Secundilactobacillus sp. TaxID=2813935 RepID=UPI00258AA14B
KREQLAQDWIAIAQKTGASAVHPEVWGLTKDRVRALKAAGLAVNVWTVNSLSKANQLFNWGVDGVFTDISQDFPSRYLN